METLSPALPAEHLHTAFLSVLPRIELHGRAVFRGLRCPQTRDEAVAEMVAISWKSFLRTNAELQRRLREQQAARPGKVGSVARALGRGLPRAAKGRWGWVATATGRCREKVAQALAAAGEAQKVVVNRVRRGPSAFGRQLKLGAVMGVALVRHFRRPLLVAMVVGTSLGLGCYLAGPAVSSAVSGVAGFVGSLVASALGRLRQVLASDELPGWYAGPIG